MQRASEESKQIEMRFMGLRYWINSSSINTFWLLSRLRAASALRDPKSTAGTSAGGFAMTAQFWHCGREGITALSASDTKAFLAKSR